MDTMKKEDISKLYIPPVASHKGQNGKLLIVGGSHLFHAASLWALTVASRIVDLVHYCSVPENNAIVQHAKEEFRNGIIVSRADVDAYVQEDDAILIGPGMTRDAETEQLTNDLFRRYPQKQWVIDAGSLQMLDLSCIPKNAILTPHAGEFEILRSKAHIDSTKPLEEQVLQLAQRCHCMVLVKGPSDIAAAPDGSVKTIEGGNAGMTKGGTGDVLAGLIAALSCKNDPWLATIAGSYINKRAGDHLFQSVGPYFNATDLANAIPVVMKEIYLQ